jgi:hypothetical protein
VELELGLGIHVGPGQERVGGGYIHGPHGLDSIIVGLYRGNYMDLCGASPQRLGFRGFRDF